nr:MAG TPA: hypothetical protein [Caudoviricetes sp.]
MIVRQYNCCCFSLTNKKGDIFWSFMTNLKSFAMN